MVIYRVNKDKSKTLRMTIGNFWRVVNHKDHQLSGNLKDFRECHIEPDWLLMYKIFQGELIFSAKATGSNADLFGK